MGAPASERPRRGGIKCEFCGRAVSSAAALESHQATLHSQALKEKVRRSSISTPIQKKTTPKNVSKDSKTDAHSSEEADTPRVVKAVKPVISKPKTVTADSKNSPQASVSRTETKNAKPINKNASKSSVPRKSEYQCPVCEKKFAVQFVATKHIEKHHSNEKLSSGTLKPIILEYCKFCDDMFASPHECPNHPQLTALTFNCAGCEQQFKTSKLFDVHIADVHGDGTESMFFPLEEDYDSWKKEMEAQTECVYILMSKFNNKEVYRCSELVDSSGDTNVQICPSTIFKTTFPKGIQVHLYPMHYRHEFKKYEVAEHYKSYSVTELIEQGINNTCLSSDEDLYLQFKGLMESIILGAAKINIHSLKTLTEKAVEMNYMLNEYDEDNEMDSMSNHSIVTVISSHKVENTIASPQPTLNQNRKRGAETEDNASIKKIKGINESATVKKIAPSNNDNATAKSPLISNDNATVKSPVISNVNATVKKIAPPTTSKKNTFSLADDKDTEKILKELDSDHIREKNRTTIGQSPTFNDSYKQFIDSTIKSQNPPKPVTKKKNVVKTKMGQFKPSLSPKKEVKLSPPPKKEVKLSPPAKKETQQIPSPKRVKRVSSVAKDITYEVRERENDCNILVLKI